jgi:Domain of unknown function (DUF4150)
MSVFANGLGVSGKAMDNKTLAAMPDVCMSPPPPPAGPVPIPYPNFGMASDTTDGCTSVFLKGKEAGKKNASKYSKITGDEPATRSFGGSVVTANITGPLKFEAYSFDVMFEGGGANRFTDLTSTNHSNPGSGVSASMRDADMGTDPPDPDCKDLKDANTAFRRQNNKEPIKKNPDGTETTFAESGTVCNGKFTAGGSSSSVMGTSATSQLQKAGVEGQCEPVDTRAKIPGPTGKPMKNPALTRVPNPDYKRKPKGEDTRTKRQKKKTLGRVKLDICDGKCEHPTGGLHAHAELNVLNCVARKQAAGQLPKGGKLLLAVSWNHDGQTGDPNPCTNCEKAIKCICDNKCIELEFCSKKGKKVSACKKKGRKR